MADGREHRAGGATDAALAAVRQVPALIIEMHGCQSYVDVWRFLTERLISGASFVPVHEVYRVETDREVYTGVQGEGTPDSVLIITSGPRDRVPIPQREIRSMRPSPVSVMPDGFADNLTHQELADLLAFLQAQTSRTAATSSSMR